MEVMMFKITMGKGFHVKFENGVILSTQFGYGNYCDNNMKRNEGEVSCRNAEIAIWIDGEEGFITGYILDQCCL